MFVYLYVGHLLPEPRGAPEPGPGARTLQTKEAVKQCKTKNNKEANINMSNENIEREDQALARFATAAITMHNSNNGNANNDSNSNSNSHNKKNNSNVDNNSNNDNTNNKCT